MSRPKQGDEHEEQQRIRTATGFKDKQRLFTITIHGKLPLEKSDILAGMKQLYDHISELMRREEEAKQSQCAIVDKRTGLVGPDGSPISSAQKPRLVT